MTPEQIFTQGIVDALRRVDNLADWVRPKKRVPRRKSGPQGVNISRLVRRVPIPGQPRFRTRADHEKAIQQYIDNLLPFYREPASDSLDNFSDKDILIVARAMFQGNPIAYREHLEKPTDDESSI